jgi:hypothetical protein
LCLCVWSHLFLLLITQLKGLHSLMFFLNWFGWLFWLTLRVIIQNFVENLQHQKRVHGFKKIIHWFTLMPRYRLKSKMAPLTMVIGNIYLQQIVHFVGIFQMLWVVLALFLYNSMVVMITKILLKSVLSSTASDPKRAKFKKNCLSLNSCDRLY